MCQVIFLVMGNISSIQNKKLSLIFEEFSKVINIVQDSSINVDETKLKTLINGSQYFLKYFDHFDLKSKYMNYFYDIFDKFAVLIAGINDYYNWLLNQTTKNNFREISQYFEQDFNLILEYSTIFLKDIGEYLQKLKESPSTYCQHCLILELKIFNYSFKVEKIGILPYYQMSFLDAYRLKYDILSSKNNYINVSMQPGSGKTILTPLFVILKMLKKMDDSANQSLDNSEFILFIVQNRSEISLILSEIRKIKLKEDEDLMFNYSSSLRSLIEIKRKKQKIPFLSILTSHDGIQFLKGNNSAFYKKATFIFNDINIRKIETDVLLQNILDKGAGTAFSVFISTIPDEYFLNVIGDYDILPNKTSDDNNPNASTEIIETISSNFLTKKNFVNQIISIINLCSSKNDKYQIGNCILFLTSDSQGGKLIKILKNYYRQSDSIYVLKNKIGPKEKIESFYQRVFNEIESVDNNDNYIFLLPVHLVKTDNSYKNEIKLSNSNIPPPLIGKVMKLILTSDFYVFSPNTTIVLDTGIIQTDSYDNKTGFSNVNQFLLPDPYRELRKKIVFSHNLHGKYIKFEVQDKSSIKALPHIIQRTNLGKSLLSLRDLDINIETQSNLSFPLDKSTLQDCVQKIKNLEILDEEGELTELGTYALQFSAVDPPLAIAIAKYGSIHDFDDDYLKFGFLISLIIDNSFALINNPNSEFLFHKYNKESDIITILDSIYFICDKNNTVNMEETGLAENILSAIFFELSNFENSNDGEKSVYNTIKWAKDKYSNFIVGIDSFLSQIDSSFIDNRKGTFLYICNAGPDLTPRVVFRSLNPLLAFDEKKPKISIIQRPGWNGLSISGSVIAFGILREEMHKMNRGFLVHRYIQPNKKILGTVSQENNNISINNCFFISLFEAYWNREANLNSFNGIWFIKQPDPNKQEHVFLIHTSEMHGHVFINFCPKVEFIEDKMRTTIEKICTLMPFVPRSILIKNDVPKCYVELTSYGTQNFTHHIYLPDSKLPTALPINSNTLDYVSKYVDILAQTLPRIRFAITGESFIYKFINGKQRDIDLRFPDTRAGLKSVFNFGCASHLVILIDHDILNFPSSIQFIPWDSKESNNEEQANNNSTEIIDSDSYTINMVSKNLSRYCSITKSSDAFFISLDNERWIIDDYDFEQPLHHQVLREIGLSNDLVIQSDMNTLFQSITSCYIQNQELNAPIPIKKLTSYNPDAKFSTENQQSEIINTIQNAIMKLFSLNDRSDVDALFIGNSKICLKIKGIQEQLCYHLTPLDLYDNSYQRCEADNLILSALQKIGLNAISSFHQPCIEVACKHSATMHIDDKFFYNEICKQAHQYGFLISKISDYIQNQSRKGNTYGKVIVELYGTMSGLAFSLQIDNILRSYSNINMPYAKGSQTSSHIQSRSVLDPKLGQAPLLNKTENAYHIKENEIENLKQLLDTYSNKFQKQWEFNDKYRVLIAPASDKKAIQSMMRKLKHNLLDYICFFICSSDTPILLSSSICIYEKDGKVKKYGICQECMLSSFQSNESLMYVIDKNTLQIDQSKLLNMTSLPKPIPTVDCNEDGEYIWPQVPIGQLAWALLSDQNSEIGQLLKCWFTSVYTFIIRNSRNYFTYCPNHPAILIPIPKPGSNFKCPHCSYIYCDDCKTWHNKSELCPNLDPSIKKCPNCGIFTVKLSGCNHITCRCGCHWCYKCDKPEAYKTGDEVYSHMHDAHGGFFT